MSVENSMEQWLNKALRSIGYKQQTAKEIKMRLCDKGCPPEYIEEIVDELIELRALDDYKYAYQYTMEKVEKGYSKWLIGLRLREKGVDFSISDAAYDEYCEINQLSQIEVEKQQIHKLMNSMVDGRRSISRQDEARMIRRLKRYGHQLPQIIDVIRLYKD